MQHKEELDSSIIYSRDYGYDYFGFKTLERSYLLKLDGEIAERPQHMLMRVSLGIHLDDLESVKETYELMSKNTLPTPRPHFLMRARPNRRCPPVSYLQCRMTVLTVFMIP